MKTFSTDSAFSIRIESSASKNYPAGIKLSNVGKSDKKLEKELAPLQLKELPTHP